MYHYASKSDCPSRAALAQMTLKQAAAWVAKACTHEGEISRLAQMQTWFGLTRDQADAAHRAGVDAMIADWPTRAPDEYPRQDRAAAAADQKNQQDRELGA